MHFSTLFIATVASMGAVKASPAPNSERVESMLMWNGTRNIPVEVLTRAAVSESELEKREGVSCKGSSRCSNTQKFKDDCSDAYFKVEATTYTSKGASSGVCSGKCGLFVAGPKSCSAKGSQLSAAYNTIRSAGCEACGFVNNYGSGATSSSCQLQVNYVSGCTV